MDLAHYCVNAVLVEGRSVRDVAAAMGRSKSWVQPHVQLYRVGGDEALVARRRGPREALNRTLTDMEAEIVSWRKSLSEKTRCGGADHWLSPGPAARLGAGGAHDSSRAGASRLRDAPAPEETTQFLDLFRGESGQRVLAVQYDALAARRLDIRRDHQLHRRLQPRGAG